MTRGTTWISPQLCGSSEAFENSRGYDLFNLNWVKTQRGRAWANVMWHRIYPHVYPSNFVVELPIQAF